MLVLWTPDMWWEQRFIHNCGIFFPKPRTLVQYEKYIKQTQIEGHSSKQLTSPPQIHLGHEKHSHSREEPKESSGHCGSWTGCWGSMRTLMEKWWNSNEAWSCMTCSIPVCTSLLRQGFLVTQMWMGRNPVRGLWELSLLPLQLFLHKPKLSPKEKLTEKGKKDVIHNLPLYSSTQNCFVGSENVCCEGVRSGLFQQASIPKWRGASLHSCQEMVNSEDGTRMWGNPDPPPPRTKWSWDLFAITCCGLT